MKYIRIFYMYLCEDVQFLCFHIFCEKMKGVWGWGGLTKIRPPAHETALIIYRLHITLKINK